MKRIGLNTLHIMFPTLEELQKTFGGVGVSLRPALIALAAGAASYLFIAALALEDRLGYRTLTLASSLILVLRAIGHLLEVLWKGFVIPSIPLVFTAALIVAARYLLILFSKNRIHIRKRDFALAEILGLLAAGMLCAVYENPILAALTGMLAGLILLALAPQGAGQKANVNRLLFLIPLVLGLALRFYALAQVPNGYAQHAAILDAEIALPLLETFSSSLIAHHLQPFFGMVGDLLLHEQSGALPVVEALGFKFFGVSLTITRLISAALGTLTLYVAYRLGEELGDRRLGLVFSFLLAVSPWHVTISRYATAEHVLSPLQFLLSLLFVIRAANHGRIIDALLAAFFTAMGWFIYATSLVVPFIAAFFLLYRAFVQPRMILIRWLPILLGLGFFALLSYMPINQIFPLGLFGPDLRTGHLDATPLFSRWPDRLQMAKSELNQLFMNADDPWFSTPGPGLGAFQVVLLVPGILLAADALRTARHRDFGVLILLGLPLAAGPAVFATDASFRRLILVTTLIALAAAFVLVRLLDTAKAGGVPRKIIILTVCVCALAVASSGAFGYFDRVSTGEEVGNCWFRSLGAVVSDHLGKEPLLVVSPSLGDTFNLNRYLKLMNYDALASAQQRGIPQGSLYTVTFCSDNVDTGKHRSPAPPRLLVLPDFIIDLPEPCGPGYLARLIAQNPGSPVLIVTPSPLPADLAPAKP